MRAIKLDDLITPVTARRVALALGAAHEMVTGEEPTRATIALATAQSALETGRWKSIHRYNLGNIKASSTYEGYYCQFRCNEVINGKVEWFDPPHPQTNFRAFLTLEEGAYDHVAFLSRRERYRLAWAALKLGDPDVYVGELKRAGYFTAGETAYRKAVVSLFDEYLRMLSKPTEEQEATLTGEELDAIEFGLEPKREP